jgi:2,5-furandicarboxylate decarboxylase 1
MDQCADFDRNNKPMEIAVILGYDPIFMVASQVSSQIYGLDKYEVDSALRGEPLELVKCETIDMLVPAYAEIVLEGIIPPKVREKEGPFGEMAGYYGGGNMQPIMEVSCVLQRNNPIFQFNFPSSSEHVLPNGLMRETHLYWQIKNMVSSVKSVHLPTVGGCRFHAIISIKKTNEGDGKSAILAALASNKDVKHVVVVDHDVDIFNPRDVEWAIATRVQADQDVVIIPGAKGSPLEPTHELRGVTAKMGIDATAPLGSLNNKFERTKIPGSDRLNIKDYFPGI